MDAWGLSTLRESLRRAVTTKVVDSMAVQKYDVRRPQAEVGRFDERFGSPTNVPVLAADGSLLHIIHKVLGA